MALGYWKELGLPGPVRTKGADGKERNPYRVYRIWDVMMKRGKTPRGYEVCRDIKIRTSTYHGGSRRCALEFTHFLICKKVVTPVVQFPLKYDIMYAKS